MRARSLSPSLSNCFSSLLYLSCCFLLFCFSCGRVHSQVVVRAQLMRLRSLAVADRLLKTELEEFFLQVKKDTRPCL